MFVCRIQMAQEQIGLMKKVQSFICNTLLALWILQI